MDSRDDRSTPHVSWLWATTSRPSGASWWGERPALLRHSTYWLLALGLPALAVFDTSKGATTQDKSAGGAALVVSVVGLTMLMAVTAIFREWDLISTPRSVSRVLVLLAFLLGALTFLLVRLQADVAAPATRGWAVLALLLWNVADVVPVVGLPDALGWAPPESPGGLVVGGSVVVVRAFVAVVLLAAVKKLWQRWLDFEQPPQPLRDRWWWLGHQASASSADAGGQPES